MDYIIITITIFTDIYICSNEKETANILLLVVVVVG